MEKTAWGPTILLGSGNYFDYSDPEGSLFLIEDIAKGLSKQCRFAGQIDDYYSIAEHSGYVGDLCPEEDRLEGHLHDSPECLIADLVSPFKRTLPDYKAYEKRLEPVVLSRMGARKFLPPSVKEADMIMLRTETEFFFGTDVANDWPPIKGLESANIQIRCLSPKEAEIDFLERYYDLWVKRAKDIQNGKYADCYR